MPSDPAASTRRNSLTNPKLISVVVCTFNRAEMLRCALTSLREQQTFGKIKFEILVVDDGSTDSTERVVTAQQDATDICIRLVRQKNAGVAAARNRGIIEARGDWIAFFDDDQIAESNWLVRLTENAVAKDADCVGGPCLLRLPEGCDSMLDSTIRRLLGETVFMPEQNFLDARLDPRKRVPTPGTGNALVKRTIFDQVGLFSESRAYGEDREFFKRALKAGAYFAIAPSAIVYHIVPSSRLTEAYLLRTAANGGQSEAELGEYKTVLWHSFLRLGHLIAVVIPKLGYAFVLRNRTGVLGRKCSIRYSLKYIAVALRRMKRQCTSSPCPPAKISTGI